LELCAFAIDEGIAHALCSLNQHWSESHVVGAGVIGAKRERKFLISHVTDGL